MGIENDDIIMKGVVEYGDVLPVCLGWDKRRSRPVIKAFNEG